MCAHARVPAGERMLRALYGQSQALPASLFDMGISPHINASIIIMVVLLLPKDLLPFPWADRLREARKEGKGVSCGGRERAMRRLLPGLGARGTCASLCWCNTVRPLPPHP
jgi:hypothetical protein